MKQFTTSDRRYLKKLLPKLPNSATRIEITRALEEDDFENLLIALGAAEFYKDKPEGARYNAPYAEIGARLWSSLKDQLHQLICGKSGAYAKERSELRASGKAALIVLVPMIFEGLQLPPKAIGVVILLAMIIAKVGLRSFCEGVFPAEMTDASAATAQKKKDPRRSPGPPRRPERRQSPGRKTDLRRAYGQREKSRSGPLG